MQLEEMWRRKARRKSGCFDQEAFEKLNVDWRQNKPVHL
jgi:hypothetical protein